MLVKENSVENWKPEKPSVSAGARLRGAKTTPSSDVSERKRWLSGIGPLAPIVASRLRTRSLSSARATPTSVTITHTTARGASALMTGSTVLQQLPGRQECMISPMSKREPTPLVAAAVALDDELEGFEQLAREVARLPLDSQRSLERAAEVLRHAANADERLAEKV